MIVANATNLGFRVGYLRSKLSQGERDDLIDKFNDPSSGIDIMVSGFALSGFGLNLHHVCAKAIIVQLTWNSSTIMQAVGRISRIGQTKPVTVAMIKVRGSFMCSQERRITKKFAYQALAGSRIPPIIAGDARELLAYELVREAWGQPFNRFR